MPRRSKIDRLPAAARRKLEARIIAAGFGDYVEHARWLRDELGHDIGKSAVGEYGGKLERRLAAIKASTEAAKLITAAAPDEADERSNAIISLVQTEIFESLLALQEAAEEADPATRVDILGNAAKSIAALSRASVARNKWAAEVRGKLDAARDEIRKLATGAGMSADTMAAIDARLQGVVV
ncbi:MAG: DUF3486 family protein [Proteobacteria bacterium]|nr:DUF3486 family protein [Pseudomonadota bacterium]